MNFYRPLLSCNNTPLFWLPRLFCLQSCWEQFSCIHGYIILTNYVSVAWQWVFPALDNSAFRTCQNILVLWNQGIQTERLHIIIKNNRKKICTLIDDSVQSDWHLTHKKQKIKHKNLCIETQRMLNMKCFVIPVVIGATGTVTRELRKYLVEIPGKHCIDSLQKLPSWEHHT
jgi:hypothetical protein